MNVKTRLIQKASATVIVALTLALLSVLFFGWLAEEVLENDTAHFDDAIRSAVHAHASVPLTYAMRAVSDIGAPAGVTLITLGACVILWRAGRRREAVVLAITMIGSQVVMYTLKVSFHRHRPEAYFNLREPTSFSFPSGHAVSAFCLYGMLAHLWSEQTANAVQKRLAWIGAALMAAMIGFSRIYLGVHYPSDVIAGYAAGMVWIGGVISAEYFLRTER